MKTTPAFSIASRMEARLPPVGRRSRRSNVTTVVRDTSAAVASLSWDQPSMARAPRHCLGPPRLREEFYTSASTSPNGMPSPSYCRTPLATASRQPLPRSHERVLSGGLGVLLFCPPRSGRRDQLSSWHRSKRPTHPLGGVLARVRATEAKPRHWSTMVQEQSLLHQVKGVPSASYLTGTRSLCPQL